MKLAKKLLKVMPGIVLAGCLMLGLMPSRAIAAEASDETQVLQETTEPVVVDLPEHETSAQSIMLFTLDETTNLPVLKSTNEVKWIDRLEGLPTYATDFYSWLEESTDGDGTADYMIDPTKLEPSGGDYFYEIVKITEEVPFTFEPGADEATIEDACDAAAEKVRAKYDQSTILPYIQAVYNAFDRDHPEVFWLSGQSRLGTGSGYATSYRPSAGTGTITYNQSVYFYLKTADFDVRDSAYLTPESITTAITNRDRMVTNILSGIAADATRYEKIQYLNTYLTTHNCYNSSADLNNIASDCRECISALKGSNGVSGPVCEGYARAFKVLCDELSIPCVLVDGNANNGAHMWNYVQMEDGKWYAVDVTWNDPVVSGRPTDVISGSEGETYLLVGSDTMGMSHTVSNQVSSQGVAFTNGPVLAESKYEVLEKLAGYTLSLGGNIAINFHMELSNKVAESTSAYMQFTLPDGSTETQLVSDANTISENGKTYYVFSAEVAAKEMTSPVKAQIIVDENTKGTEYTYTVKEYADYIINAGTYDVETVALVKAMLNYGAYSQLHFNTKTDKLANMSLAEGDKDVSSVTAADLKGYKMTVSDSESLGEFYGANLVLKSETTLKVYFEPAENVDADNLALTFTIDNNPVTPERSGQYYVMRVDNIVSSALDTKHIFTVTAGTEKSEMEYSAMSYCYNVLSREGDIYTQDLKNVVSALYLYNVASDAYENSN